MLKPLVLFTLAVVTLVVAVLNLVGRDDPTASSQVITNQQLTPHAGRPHPLTVRVPAEWEPHAATWMQWPRGYESSYRPAFAEIIDILQDYEPLHIVAHNPAARNQARDYLTSRGVPLANLSFHVMPIDSAWMRDNGPVWIERHGHITAQDWGFDGWGGLTSQYSNDNAIPPRIAAAEGLSCENWNHLVHERGDLEFNGTDTVIVSLPCFGSRNPTQTQAQLTQSLKRAFGVSRVIWLLSAPADDVTGGHVDGIARFIDEGTAVVPRYTFSHADASVYDEAAAILQAAGIHVLRMDVQGEVFYGGSWMPALYINWLVANGVVLVPGFGSPTLDHAARQQVRIYFPNRDVHIVDTRELWYEGGSIHCVTNDQPAQCP